MPIIRNLKYEDNGDNDNDRKHLSLPIIRNLKEEDKIFPAGPLGNYSLAGFEMVT